MSPLKSIARQAEIWWRWFEMALLRLWHFEFQAKFCQNMAKNGRKRPQMTENNLNIWKITSLTLSIGFLLVLRLFWVVIWPVYDNFDFGAKIGQKWPKMAEKGPEWPNMVWISKKWHPKPSPLDFCFSCDHFEWSHDQFTTSLSLGPKLAEKWPKMAEKGPKWPKMTWTYGKWLLKPSPLKFCPSRGRFEWSHD